MEVKGRRRMFGYMKSTNSTSNPEKNGSWIVDLDFVIVWRCVGIRSVTFNVVLVRETRLYYSHPGFRTMIQWSGYEYAIEYVAGAF